MQGNPLKELLLVLALMGLLCPLILMLTGRSQPSPSAAAPSVLHHQGEKTACVIRLQFAHPPLKAGLMHHGVCILDVNARGEGTAFDVSLEFDLSERMLEMPFSAQWPEGTPQTAVTVSFQPEGMEAREVTFWSEGDLNEFIELHWHD